MTNTSLFLLKTIRLLDLNFYETIVNYGFETRVEVWENEILKWEQSQQCECFPTIYSRVLPNFLECFYNVWEHEGKGLLFFL